MLEKSYASVTVWQGDFGWEIDAIIDGFVSPLDAALFGDHVRSLVLKALF